MVVLKGYFDDSGKASDPQCNACGFAGYIGTCDQWEVFEKHWGETLKEYGVEWLHMKLFAHHRPPFEKFEHDAIRRKEFLSGLLAAVEASGISGIGDGVILSDLADFNKETGLKIQAEPFSISNSIMKMADHVKYRFEPNDTVEARCDWFDQPHKAIGLAFGYLKHDPQYQNCETFISMSPATAGTWKTVTPLQAADLLAYEAYRGSQSWAAWLKVKRPDDDLVDYLRWKSMKHPNRDWHAERRSAVELAHSSALTTQLWDIDKIRHLNECRDGKWS